MLECSEKVYSVEQKLRAFEYGQKLLGKKSLRRAWPRLPPERKLPKDKSSNCNSKNLTSTSCGGVFSAGGAWGRRRSRGMRRRKRQISELFYAPSLEK